MIIFIYLLLIDIFKYIQKNFWHILAYFCNQICHKDFSKIAQSDQTFSGYFC